MTPATKELQKLVAHLMEWEPHCGWSPERVKELALTDAQIAIVIEAEPEALERGVRRSMVELAIDALKLPDLPKRVEQLGCLFWCMCRSTAEEELLSHLEEESSRREEAELAEENERDPLFVRERFEANEADSLRKDPDYA